MTVINAKSMASDPMKIRLHYGGKVVEDPVITYVGEIQWQLIEIDMDKLSLPEIVDCAAEVCSYKKGTFSIYWHLPDMPIENHLVELKDDKDVKDMVYVYGDNPFKVITDLYVNLIQGEAQYSDREAQPGLLMTHVSPIRSDTGSHDNNSVVSGDDSEDCEYVADKDNDFCSDKDDNDDDEWISSVAAIDKVHKNDKLTQKELVQSILEKPDLGFKHDVDEVAEADENYSSYEDSDGDVNSPGDSEDDDIRGRKYKIEVPVVTDQTDWSKWKWIVGTRFPTRDDFKHAVRMYAVANGRDLSVFISDKKRQGRVGVKCVSGCPFRVYLSFAEKKSCFMVKSVKTEHTCQRNMTKNRQLSSEFVANEFLPIFKTRPHWPAKEIQDAVKEKFKLFVGKWFAYRAKSIAQHKLHGSMKEHYSKLGSYLEILKHENPTSTFDLVTVPASYHGYDSQVEVFFRLFVCFDGVRKGFINGCRKLLCLDGCFLKTFLGGMLLAAIGRDSNDQMYPVAWAVVEGENNDSWGWFMNELYKCLDVTEGGKGWTLISDQQKGLLNGVAQYWGNAEHRNCARHIYANWHKKYKGDDLKSVFWKAVRAYSEADYKLAIEDMKKISTDAVTDFIKQNPKCFCRCYLVTDSKADVVVNNMAETFNGFIIQSRSKHIINMLEDIRVAIMTRLVNKEREMVNKDFIVCPRVQKKLDKEKAKAYKCNISPSTKVLFQVKELDEVCVDIEKKTCTCRKWNLTGIPCFHACAVYGFLQLPVEEYVDHYYSKEMYLKAYENYIPPLPSEKYWPQVDLPLDPPPIKIGPGRPKKNRKKDPHEDPKKPGKLTRHGVKMSCSVCKSRTHNIRTCPNKREGTNPTQKTKRQAKEDSKNVE
ncbi:hypothetical protein SSX86_006195 [Deinandra increscens subsp. villosa]|uniref:SWIM-type domain-containing protein n=1 Tax=Deinandra increscens subsp. villosa TaxID=3103831 RepID=A0AAP0DRW8_9ASTR